MSRGQWDVIKQSKNFYISTYRKASTALIISAGLNVVLAFGMYFAYLNRPVTDYYATSGITPPIELQAMSAANSSSSPLLASDPVNTNDNKVIPQ
jgi:intracellular multiplication protein IcmM